MSNTRRTVTAGLLALVLLAAGCNSEPPTTPRHVPFPAPTIVSVAESRGSTGGGAEVRIGGTGFFAGDGGAVVIFGGVHAPRVTHSGTNALFVTVPAHAEGLVDLVVVNPDGQTARMARAYTYVSPDSFDPNGEWNGLAAAGDVEFRFIVENRKLTAVSCGTSGWVSFSPAPAVGNGEFAFSREDGVAVAGRLVTAGYAIGTIKLAPCTNSDWFAKLASFH